MLEIRFVPLASAQLWEGNPKKHDIKKLAEALTEYGFQLPPKFDAALGGIVFGNGRITALRQLQQSGQPAPRGIALTENGDWVVPILFGNDLESKAIAEAFAIDHNNLVLSGGGFTAVYASQIWDEEQYVKLLVELSQANALPVTLQSDDVSTLMTMIYSGAPAKEKTTTNISIGIYVNKLPIAVYNQWAEELSVTYNFDEEAIITELKRRLGLDEIEERCNAKRFSN